MSENTECIHGIEIGCSICNPRPKPPPEPDSRPFVAKYDSQCPECDLPIYAGRQRIILRPRSWGNQAIHAGCA